MWDTQLFIRITPAAAALTSEALANSKRPLILDFIFAFIEKGRPLWILQSLLCNV